MTRVTTMRLARSILVAAGLVASACSHERRPTDADRDGVAAGTDCDDSNPAVYASVTAYRDVDGDGVGAGSGAPFCTGGSAPPGYALAGADCAPDDPARWRLVDKLVDLDGDGFTSHEEGSLCTGAALPPPYLSAASGNDCDDSDASLYRWVVTYRDQDGDGVGARPRSISCLGAQVPGGTSIAGYDADDADPTVVSAPEPDDLRLLLD